jgi:hypothetical protein
LKRKTNRRTEDDKTPRHQEQKAQNNSRTGRQQNHRTEAKRKDGRQETPQNTKHRKHRRTLNTNPKNSGTTKRETQNNGLMTTSPDTEEPNGPGLNSKSLLSTEY